MATRVREPSSQEYVFSKIQWWRRLLRAITFDVGETIFSDSLTESATDLRLYALSSLFLQNRIDIDLLHLGEALHQALESQGGTSARNPIRAADVAKKIIEQLPALSSEVPEAEIIALLEEPLPDRWHPVPHVFSMLAGLRTSGIRLGIVSNVWLTPGQAWRRVLKAHRLIDFFEPNAIIFSDEVGLSKPDPNIFHLVLNYLGAQPNEAAHVGDRKETDVRGARTAGMQTVRFSGIFDDRADMPDADFVIDDFRLLNHILIQRLH